MRRFFRRERTFRKELLILLEEVDRNSCPCTKVEKKKWLEKTLKEIPDKRGLEKLQRLLELSRSITNGTSALEVLKEIYDRTFLDQNKAVCTLSLYFLAGVAETGQSEGNFSSRYRYLPVVPRIWSMAQQFGVFEGVREFLVKPSDGSEVQHILHSYAVAEGESWTPLRLLTYQDWRRNTGPLWLGKLQKGELPEEPRVGVNN